MKEGVRTAPRRVHPLAGKRFVFAGNRACVLDEMLAKGFAVEIFVVPDSWLERTLKRRGIGSTLIEGRDHLVACLESMEYDYFIANGCPYILPVSRLRKGGRTFVNVHPGPLPDLRGIDPVPGALLSGHDSGAACHIMDDGIDTGPIVSRVIVPMSDDLDAGLLYQISFLAEKEAFNIACERAFLPAPEFAEARPGLYYSRKPEDLEISFSEPVACILRRIRAFSNRSRGAHFTFRGRQFRVFDAEPVNNPFLSARRDAYRQGEVVFRYEDCLLVRLGPAFLKLKAIEGDLSVIHPGDNLAIAAEPQAAAPAA